MDKIQFNDDDNIVDCGANLGDLEIGTGTFDVNGSFNGVSGEIDFTANGRLQLSGTVTYLGNLDNQLGIVEYDGGTQNVVYADYYNLEIDGTGDKTLSGSTTVSNQLTFSANQDFVTNGHTLTITTTPSGYSDDRLIKGGSSSTVSVKYQASSGTICYIPVGIDGNLRTIGIGPLSAETFTVVYTPGSPGTINWNTTPSGAPVEPGGPVVHVNNHYYYDISIKNIFKA